MIIAITPVCICFCVQINQVPSPRDSYCVNHNFNSYNCEEKCTNCNYVVSKCLIHTASLCFAPIRNNQIICLSFMEIANPYVIIQLGNSWIVFMIADRRTALTSSLPFISNFSLSFRYDQILDHWVLVFALFPRIHFRWRSINENMASSALYSLRLPNALNSADLPVELLGPQCF